MSGDVTEVATPGACVTVRLAGVPVRLVRQHTPGLPFVLNGMLRCVSFFLPLAHVAAILCLYRWCCCHCCCCCRVMSGLLVMVWVGLVRGAVRVCSHEEKTSVVHFSITKMPGVEDPIKSKVGQMGILSLLSLHSLHSLSSLFSLFSLSRCARVLAYLLVQLSWFGWGFLSPPQYSHCLRMLPCFLWTPWVGVSGPDCLCRTRWSSWWASCGSTPAPFFPRPTSTQTSTSLSASYNQVWGRSSLPLCLLPHHCTCACSLITPPVPVVLLSGRVPGEVNIASVLGPVCYTPATVMIYKRFDDPEEVRNRRVQ